MMKNILCFIFIICICACSNPIDRRLDYADSLLANYPDSALSILGLPDRDIAGNERRMARWCLLYTQAQYRNYIVESDFTNINKAVDYYRKENEDESLMKALFYRASMHYDNADYSNAALDAMLSNKIAHNLNEPLWIAMSAEKLADVCKQTSNRAEDIVYAIEAADNFLAAGKILNHRYALCDLASAYGNNRQFDRCLELMDSVALIALYENPVDSALLSYCCNNAIDFAQWADSMAIAERFQEYADRYCKIDTLSCDYFCRMAEFCFKTNDSEGVKRNLDRALETVSRESDRADVYFRLVRYYKKWDMPEQAIVYYDSVLNIEDRLLGETFKQTEVKAQRDYYDRLAAEEAENTRRMRVWLAVVLAGAAVLAIFGVTLYRMRLRVKNAELNAAVADMELLRADMTDRLEMKNEEIAARSHDIILLSRSLEGARSRAAEMASRLQEVFRDSWSALDVLSREFDELPESDRARMAMIKRINKEIAKMRAPENIAKIVEIVDEMNHGLLGRIREQYVAIDDKAVEFLALLLTGMSMRSVALFSGLKYRSAYTRRSRLLEIIAAGDTPDRDTLLALLVTDDDNPEETE